MEEAEEKSQEHFSARPEARFALATGVAGALIAVALTVAETLQAPGPASAAAYIYLPFVAICTGVLAGVWGIALGCVWCSVTGKRNYFRAVLLLAWFLVLAFPAVALWLSLAG